jgi:hypothetical protein
MVTRLHLSVTGFEPATLCYTPLSIEGKYDTISPHALIDMYNTVDTSITQKIFPR